jgi:membrane protein involved in colicin uptake
VLKRLARVKPRFATEIAPARVCADETETTMSPTTRRRKPARKAAKTKRPAARRKTAARKVAKKAASRKTAKKSATKRSAARRAPRKAPATSATRKKAAAKSARRAPSKAAPRPAPQKSAARPAAAPKKAAAPRKRAASADVARQHFLQILEAKQQRVKQGPSYPAPNAFTGRLHDAVGAVKLPPGEPAQGSTPDVEATYGEGEFASGRGNQGMRGQN